MEVPGITLRPNHISPFRKYCLGERVDGRIMLQDKDRYQPSLYAQDKGDQHQHQDILSYHKTIIDPYASWQLNTAPLGQVHSSQKHNSIPPPRKHPENS